MNHKILFVDLDATLLSDDKTVSEENRAAIQKMLPPARKLLDVNMGAYAAGVRE